MTRTLIKGATIITMDAQGDLPQGDILVTGDTLTDVAPVIHADDAVVVDGAGFIIIPGLINAHMHTWQTALRGLAANWTLMEYFQKMHAGLALVFTPQDLHIATLMGALNQINCGTTTLADWCHNNPTPEHNDAWPAGVGHTRCVFSWHGQAGPQAGANTVLGSTASACRS
jgi:cytosine/adenosine deaminase-related metal-dependent hydrolase